MDTWHSASLYDFYRLYRATNDPQYARLLANEAKLTTQYPGNPLGYCAGGQRGNPHIRHRSPSSSRM